MKFLNVEKPRCLSLKALDWEDSQVVRPFKDCGLADGFMKVWKLKFHGSINQQTGDYIYTSNNGHRKAATTPTALLPATKRARLQEESTDDGNAFNESEMDENIKEHFLGK